MQEKFGHPEALDYLRKQIAEYLGESNRDATRDLSERRASLARTEQRIAALIRFLADGDNSEYVVTALRDLHAQARTEKAAIAALEARGASPIALPTPAEVAERAPASNGCSRATRSRFARRYAATSSTVASS